MTEADQIACSLDGREREVRLAAARGVGEAALIAHDVGGRRHMLRFRSSHAARERLEEIVEAERTCCPFLSLDLTQGGDEILLSIDAPPGAETIAAGLAMAFARGDA